MLLSRSMLQPIPTQQPLLFFSTSWATCCWHRTWWAIGEHIVGNACSRSRACSWLSPPSCSSTPIFVPVSGMVQRITSLLVTQLLHQVQLWLHLPFVGGMGMEGIQSLQQISQSKRFCFHGHGIESMPGPHYVVRILQVGGCLFDCVLHRISITAMQISHLLPKQDQTLELRSSSSEFWSFVGRFLQHLHGQIAVSLLRSILWILLLDLFLLGWIQATWAELPIEKDFPKNLLCSLGPRCATNLAWTGGCEVWEQPKAGSLAFHIHDLPVQKSPMGQGLVCGGSFGSHILQSGTAQPTYSFIALPTRKIKTLWTPSSQLWLKKVQPLCHGAAPLFS